MKSAVVLLVLILAGTLYSEMITMDSVSSTEAQNFSLAVTAFDTGSSIAIRAEVIQGVGDIIGIYIDFDVELPETLPTGSITLLMTDNNPPPPQEVSIEDPKVVIDNNSLFKIGRGNNLNGLKIDGNQVYFDLGVQVGERGLATDIDPVTVLIKNDIVSPSLSIHDILMVGVRLQSTGTGTDSREGSAKLAFAPPTTNVPEPASLALLGGALIGMALFRKRTGPRR